jgi:hypothetical protein
VMHAASSSTATIFSPLMVCSLPLASAVMEWVVGGWRVRVPPRLSCDARWDARSSSARRREEGASSTSLRTISLYKKRTQYVILPMPIACYEILCSSSQQVSSRRRVTVGISIYKELRGDLVSRFKSKNLRPLGFQTLLNFT